MRVRQTQSAGQKFWCFVRLEGMDRDAVKEWTASTPTERVVTGNRGSTDGEGNMVVLKERKKKRQ
jgi:hypothetical protein